MPSHLFSPTFTAISSKVGGGLEITQIWQHPLLVEGMAYDNTGIHSAEDLAFKAS